MSNKDDEPIELIPGKKKKIKLSKKTKKIFLLIVVSIVALCGIYCLARYQEARSLALLNSQIEEEKIDPYATVLREINEMGVLDSVEVYYDEIIEKETVEQGWFDINIPLSDKHYLVLCSGVIHAGVDLTQATVEEEPSKIVINLPCAAITSNELDEDSMRYYDVLHNVFNKVEIEDVQEARVAIKEQANEHALERGILGAAEENAKNLLISMYTPLMEETGFELEINFVDMTEPAE